LLTTSAGQSRTVTFAELEQVLGFQLPPSARKYRPWWANQSDGAHVQAQAWMGAGWRVSSVDLREQTVRFVRGEERSLSGMEAPASQTFDHDIMMISRRILSLSALRLVEMEQAEAGCTEAEAVAALLDRLARERKLRLLEQFPLTGEPSAVDSVDLIREDRDAR
jgi:hypothetical protein